MLGFDPEGEEGEFEIRDFPIVELRCCVVKVEIENKREIPLVMRRDSRVLHCALIVILEECALGPDC